MKSDNKLTIGLISHYFSDSNLGCVALSICSLLLIDKAAKEMGITVDYVIMVNEKAAQVPLDFTKSRYEYRVYSSTKQTLKHPVRFLRSKIFDGCDAAFNLCAGDGFTDIYGAWRTFSESYMTLLGSEKKCRMILAPQTIGPFNNGICRALAKYTMDRCEYIFVRDNPSARLCQEMGQGEKTKEVIDVALALPYTKTILPGRFNLGINVSGLLYNDPANRFRLRFDYPQFVERIIELSAGRDLNIHLIPHVNIKDGKGEDDYAACEAVHKKFPGTILVPRFDSPIKAKSYISGLDLFTGARMHATIASISSGVPVIPIAYSRKVNGLYGNLDYPYFIDAKDEKTDLERAVKQFALWLDEIDEMKAAAANSKRIYTAELDKYTEALKAVFSEIMG